MDNYMTDSEKLQAISARISGVWSNEQLMKIGELEPDTLIDIIRIINHPYKYSRKQPKKENKK